MSKVVSRLWAWAAFQAMNKSKQEALSQEMSSIDFVIQLFLSWLTGNQTEEAMPRLHLLPILSLQF